MLSISESAFLELKSLLDEKHDQYNQIEFIENDPISIPHRFTTKEDIEISGFLAALIAWGKRAMIIKSANKMMNLTGNAPHDFITNAKLSDFEQFDSFVHRTFNATDITAILIALQIIYKEKGGLETIFSQAISPTHTDVWNGIIAARSEFIHLAHFPKRTHKHLSNPAEKSAAKRINMFLRWMVRKDNRKVDFGIWQNISPNQLICPLDVHTGNIGRKLGLLTRKYDDKQAADELTQNLKLFCPNDPVKYDFSLFGLGVNKEIE